VSRDRYIPRRHRSRTVRFIEPPTTLLCPACAHPASEHASIDVQSYVVDFPRCVAGFTSLAHKAHCEEQSGRPPKDDCRCPWSREEIVQGFRYPCVETVDGVRIIRGA